MKASDLFVKCLEAEGVKYVFGVPGEENLDFLESLRSSSIQLILCRHEQAGGFMAATLGRLTGHAGVCLSTLGPGATNLVTAAAYAQLGGMPMVMLTGQKPVKTSKQGQFQIVDVVGMMKPLTKYTRSIVSAHNIPSRVREVFRLAEEERPGATHLELPEDIAAEESDEPVIEPRRIRRPVAEAKAVVQAAYLIQSARYPLLVIGAGANRKMTSKTLRQLVDKTGFYFCTTQMGKGVIDERHPLFLGTCALSDGDYLHCALDRADMIINVGHDVVEKPPFFMKPGGTQVVHINFSSAEVDPVYFPQCEVVGDVANSLWQLCEALTPQKHWDFSYYKKVKKEVEIHVAEGSVDERFPLLPQRLVADVRAVMPDDGILALDNGMYKIWFARNYKAHEPNTVLLDNALASMGAGLPSAMAAKLVYPGRKVVAVCGDGGFMMNSQELETAVRLNLDLTILILNDNGYGMIQWKQSGLGYTEWGLDFGNPDFVKYAQAYGAKGQRLHSAEELKPSLQKLLDSRGVSILEVPVDYSENVHTLTTVLKERTCSL
ncbi:MAG: acetolactate synthase large subunit [Candidatus Omnitrophica bacterium]|nr:acetolactate synthase large subunit [Candidatus Omnitrophota bacterium]